MTDDRIELPGGYWLELGELFGDESYGLRYISKNGVEQAVAEDISPEDARDFAAAMATPPATPSQGQPAGVAGGVAAEQRGGFAIHVGPDDVLVMSNCGDEGPNWTLRLVGEYDNPHAIANEISRDLAKGEVRR